MKMKYLVIVSLMLAILAIGAVSAADDVASDDSLAADDSNDVQIVESSVDEEIISGDKDFEGGDVNLYILDEIETNQYSAFSGLAQVYDEDGVNGTVSISIDNVQYYNEMFDSGSEYAQIYSQFLDLPDNLKTGNHTVLLSYLKNGVSSPYTFSQKSEFTFSPAVLANDVAVGETAYVFIDGGLGSSGTATLYNFNGTVGSTVATVTLVDGKAKIQISGLAKGEHQYYLNMTVNGKNYVRYPNIEVCENTAGFSSSISSTQIVSGNSVVVKVNGPKSNSMVYIYIDEKPIKAVSLIFGGLSESISGLSVGQHVIKVGLDENLKFYSSSFTVDVKAPAPKDTVSLVLKTVKVKKSAKKLVLQATLKINSKAGAGKKVTFTFNGKKFTGTANKNGVAKVTVKSKVLKKLKVGKKVKYQAQYLKTTAKKTAKVKK
ncbi:hypothetical protein [Methanobrevibacter sp.]|uniref:hypothetical protein n=1 Tax=Methanobrevibacter sp. TaxID=66852 RepID=UPI00386A90A3